MTEWITKWRKTDFQNVENKDLFQRLDSLVNACSVRPLFVSEKEFPQIPNIYLLLD
jgi:ribonuclease HI